jgi:hypothetical protein
MATENKNNSFDIFGTKAIEVDTHNREKKNDSVIFAPKAKDASDGIYEAKVRFLYNPSNPTKSIIHKVTYFLKDEQDKGYTFDSPQSVGDWNSCECAQLWRKLSKSESALDRKNAEKLQKRDVFYSLVYIINDAVKPANNGKIMVMKYGVKLKAKLDRYLNPKTGKKVDIFNFFNGRNMDLYITRQGNFNNYDDTSFEDSGSAIEVNGVEVEANDAGREILQKFMANAPSLDQFEYKPMSSEDQTKLQSILNQYRSPGDAVSAITNKPASKPAAKVASKPAAKVEADDDDDTDAPQTTSKEGGDENLDEFLDNLGI